MINILVVDDSVLMRNTLRSVLEAQGDMHVVGEAADGIAAFQLAQNLRPEVVLMDVSMGRMDGVEATRRIRALLPDTVVIGMSCHVGRQVESEVLSAGADAFLPKEAVPERLLDVIAKETQH